MSCPSILSVCEDNYLQEREEELLERIIVQEHLRNSLEFCQNLNQAVSSLEAKHIEKRSPKKKGSSGGGGRSRGGGRVSSKVRSAFSSSAGRKGQKALSSILHSRKKTFGTPGKFGATGVKRKGGILRKVGKYAVVGLAGK